jgi:transaldolase
MTDSLAALSQAGVSIWLDDLSRERLQTGSLADLAARHHVVGVTTNPTIFAHAITASAVYGDQVSDLAARGVDVGEALRTLTTFDVRWACDVLRPAYDATDGVDGRVSIEVDPRLAHDAQATIAEARALWWLVDRPNLFIKIPATPRSLPAIGACLAEGISVNVTLIFSLDRYDAVMNAYVDGMERALQAGRDLASIGSVASFFVSRVDTEIDSRLDKIGGPEAADHGDVPADSIHGSYAESQLVLDGLRDLGVSYADSMQSLEDEAVVKFEASWAQLSDHLAETLRARPIQDRREP